MLKLKFDSIVHSLILLNQPYTICLAVITADQIIACARRDLHVKVKAYWASKPNAPCPPFVEISSTNLVVGEDGRVSIEIKITELSSEHEHQGIQIGFELIGGTGSSSVVQQIDSTPLITPILLCVSQRLVVETRDEKSNTMNDTFTWYKDEGGKDKCIELRVKLMDATGSIVTNHQTEVPLCAKVVYESGRMVEQQNILVVNEHDSRKSIDSSGTGVIKLRINEVSSKHRDQKFVIFLAPVGASHAENIAPAYSVTLPQLLVISTLDSILSSRLLLP